MIAGYYQQQGWQSHIWQRVSLDSPGCLYKGTIQHEFMHALGLMHEQSRGDRDNYINIHWNNVQPGMEHNFNKYDHFRTVYGYDYSSVMHYDWYAFSKDPYGGLATITKKDGSRAGFGNTEASALDIYALRYFYCY